MAVDIPQSVLNKLVIFTTMMLFFPLVVFFTAQYVFNSNSIVSGGLAAAAANVVLVGYIIAAYSEEVQLESTKKDEDIKLD